MAVTRRNERRHAFSMQNAVTRLSGFCGNLLAGILPGTIAVILGTTLDDSAVFRYPLLIPPAIYLIAFVLLLGTSEVDPRGASSDPAPGNAERPPRALLLVIAVVYLFWMAGSWTARTFFNVYMDRRSTCPRR
jgi:hypothetical protein